MTDLKNISNCPCGRNKTYENCCGKIHQNINKAKTAEDLMRSRYSAFTFANISYLKESHYSKTRNYSDKKELAKWCKSVEWLKLEVLSTELGSEFDNTGKVYFKAYYKENGKQHCIEEHSTFLKENNHWVYNTYE